MSKPRYISHLEAIRAFLAVTKVSQEISRHSDLMLIRDATSLLGKDNSTTLFKEIRLRPRRDQ